jgi:nucleotide-binding universal stress UspA family protein
MDERPFNSILHPTDFSRGGKAAFAHGLRLALAAQSALHILHVDDVATEPRGARFPQAADLLKQWGMLEPAAAPAAVERQLGVRLVEATLLSHDVPHAVGAYAEQHSCDLLALMTHEAGWMERIFRRSLAEESARLAHAPALFLRDGHQGFVNADTGKIRLHRVLMPIAAEAAPMRAWGFASALVRMLEPTAQFYLVHVGETLPTFGNLLPHVDLRQGPVVETILGVAEEIGPDLIVMATSGHHGLFDDLTGSTTERVLRAAPCPVLAIPDKQRRDRA